jgi:hypothetical protein
MPANRSKISVTLPPDNADISIATGIVCIEAHFEASSGSTSLPSGAVVAVFLAPNLGDSFVDEEAWDASDGARKPEVLLS